MTDTSTMPDTQQSITSEMRDELRLATSWDVVSRATTKSAFPARVMRARNSVKSLQEQLAALTAKSAPAGDPQSALLELKANSRLLRAAIKSVSESPRKIARLPRVTLPDKQDETRALSVAASYLRAVNGRSE